MKTASLEDGSVLHVLEEKQNKVIGRLEVSGIITHVGKGTPARKELRSAIAKIYGAKEELVILKYVKSEYGMGRSRIKIHIYESEERLKLFEPEYILKRGG